MSATVGAVGTLSRDRIDAVLTSATAGADRMHRKSWSWRCTDSVIELHADLPPVANAEHRELMIAAGVALLNVRILILGSGVHLTVRPFPDSTQRDLIAVVRPDGPRRVTSGDRALVDSLLAGTAPTFVATDTTTCIAHLRRAAKVEQCWFALLPDPALDGAVSRDGSQCAVIGTVLDGPAARLQAGQATQRVLLTATMCGLTARPVHGVLQDTESRQAVRSEIGGGLWPQSLLRLDHFERAGGTHVG